MRLATVVLSLVFVGALSVTAFAQAPAPRASTRFLFAVANATPPPQLTKEDLKQVLDEARIKNDDHPFRIECSATSWSCPTAVFISADALSDIIIKDIPQGAQKLKIFITAGETDEDQNPLFVRRVYKAKHIPDRIVITVNKPRRFKPTLARKDPAQNIQASTTSTDQARWLARESNPKGPENTTVDVAKMLPENNPSIGFIALGKSDTLAIQMQFDDDPPKTIIATLNYQRWFVDMGGFLTFSSVSDQELVTELVVGGEHDGQVKILKKRNQAKLVSGTGLALDFHLANYPNWGAQFGLATNVDRKASYYIGGAYRLRELGPRTLATIAAGIAATQATRFPDVSIGDFRNPTAIEVTQGSKRYAFGPYISLSLGFSFGGVDQPPKSATNTTP